MSSATLLLHLRSFLCDVTGLLHGARLTPLFPMLKHTHTHTYTHRHTHGRIRMHAPTHALTHEVTVKYLEFSIPQRKYTQAVNFSSCILPTACKPYYRNSHPATMPRPSTAKDTAVKEAEVYRIGAKAPPEYYDPSRRHPDMRKTHFL